MDAVNCSTDEVYHWCCLRQVHRLDCIHVKMGTALAIKIFMQCGSMLVWLSNLLGRFVERAVYLGLVASALQLWKTCLPLLWMLRPFLPFMPWFEAALIVSSMVGTKQTVVLPPVDSSWGLQWAVPAFTGIASTCIIRKN